MGLVKSHDQILVIHFCQECSMTGVACDVHRETLDVALSRY